MTPEQAYQIIDALERKHKLFKALTVQPHADGMFMTFEQIDIDPRTVYNWIEAVGARALYIGSEGNGDNRIMCAEVRL